MAKAGDLIPDAVQFRAPTRDVGSWLPGFLLGLNAFINQTIRALQHLAAGGAGAAYRPLVLQTGATVADTFPITFQNPLARAPQSVQVAKVTPSGSATLTGPVTVLWTLSNNGGVLVTSVTGLATNSNYEVVLSVS